MENIMKMMNGLNITSKAALKQFCLLATQCNVKEATELYEFLIKDLDELPMLDPVKPTAVQNIKNVATDVFNFFRDNKEGISESVDFVKAMFGKGGVPAAPIETPTEPLPPIN